MRNYILTIGIMVMFSSCTHYYYMPATQNVPLLQHKGDCKINASVGSADEVEDYGFSGAYALDNKYAVMVNYMGVNDNKDVNINYGKGKYGDVAFGYYKPFEKYIVFEVFGGIGSGTQHHRYDTVYTNLGINNTADLSLTKYFLQPSIGIMGKHFEYALTLGFSEIKFTNVNYSIDSSKSDYKQLISIDKNRSTFLWEPGITVRGGWKLIKFQLQYVSTNNLNNPNLKFETGRWSFGLHCSIGDLLKKLNRKQTDYFAN